MQQDRYCRNCGQELKPEDQFCAGCGRSVHVTAHVPTPEADVSLPPPPQAAQHYQSPRPAQSAPPVQPSQSGVWAQAKRPILWFFGSLLAASAVSAAADPTNYGEPGMNTAEAIGYFTGGLIIEVATRLFVFVPLLLVLGGFFYLFALLSGKRPSFLQALFDWQLMVVVVILIVLSGLLL